MNFEELAIVDNLKHHLAHVVGGVGVRRDDLVEHRRRPVDRIVAWDHRRRLTVRKRQVGHQRPRLHQHFDIVLERSVRHSGHSAVHLRPAELLCRQILMRHRFHDVGTGHEHVARPLDHEDEICDRRRIDRTAGTGAHDQ